MCRTRHFRSKGQCATEIQLLNTPHDRRCCRGRQAGWRHSGAIRLTRSGSHKKKCRVHVRGRGWGRQRYLPPRLRGDMATPTAIALDSSFNLLLISKILVGTNGNGRHHVIIGINHGYGWALVVARRGETTHEGVDVNNTHLSLINPLILTWLCGNYISLLEIPAIIGVKSNITIFNYVCRFFVNMFHWS